MKKQNTLFGHPIITTRFHFLPHMSLHHLVYPSNQQKKETFCVIPEQKENTSQRLPPFP